MENVVLIVHLLLALGLIAVVLLQRSEGGGLGIGGGGSAGTGRAPATPLGRVTWILAIAFIITSLTLTVLASRNASGSSVVDRLGVTGSQSSGDGTSPELPSADSLLPPGPEDNTPLVPSAD